MDKKIPVALVLAIALFIEGATAQWSASPTVCSSVVPPSAFGARVDDDLQLVKTTNIELQATVAGIAQPTKVVCPGVNYNLKVTFPTQPLKRVYTIAATTGNLTGAPGNCIKHVVNAAGSGPSIGLQLAVPCNASGSITIKVASAEAGKATTTQYWERTETVLVSPLALCIVSACPGAPKINFTTVASVLTNPATFPTAMESLSADMKTMVDANIAQQVAGLMNAVHTISSVINPNTNPSVSVPDPAAFMVALTNISALFTPKASNTTGLLGLLGAFNTITSALNGGNAVNVTLPQMLSAMKVVGNFLSGGQASTLTPSLTGLMESGMTLVQSLMKIMPASGATPQTMTLPNIFAVVKSIGGFMGQLSAII